MSVTDEDCKQIGLWRRSYDYEGRRGNTQQRESLRQKDKGNTTELKVSVYFCVFANRSVRGGSLFYCEEEIRWTSFGKC